MIRTLQALTYVKAFRTGRTCPCHLLCEDNQEVVVKLYSGNESSKTGLVCELMAALLARDLDLRTLAPVLVDVDADFHRGIPDREISERFRQSAGLNFGTLYLQGGYMTWPQERSVPGPMVQDVAEIFAFDLLVQNPDRRKEKPNLLRKGDEIIILDHELAFSFLRDIFPVDCPWRGNGLEFAKNHLFFSSLKGKGVTLARLRGAFEAIDDARLSGYMDTIPALWRSEGGDAAERIVKYLGNARDNCEELFGGIMEILT